VERRHRTAAVAPVPRICASHLATALRQAQAMDLQQKLALIDEIHSRQPNLLASCIVQAKLGADEQTIEFLLDLLIVCDLAMTASGYEWPLITADEQERQLERLVAAIQFSGDLADPAAAELARSQYIAGNPEPVLLAFALSQGDNWQRELARRQTAKESDKFVMLATINLVNCIAHAEAQRRRPS